jgi:hypothetical protein
MQNRRKSKRIIISKESNKGHEQSACTSTNALPSHRVHPHYFNNSLADAIIQGDSLGRLNRDELKEHPILDSNRKVHHKGRKLIPPQAHQVRDYNPMREYSFDEERLTIPLSGQVSPNRSEPPTGLSAQETRWDNPKLVTPSTNNSTK